MSSYFDKIQENPNDEEEDSKWQIGERVDFEVIPTFTPLFAYDYFKFDCLDYGVHNPKIDISDLQIYFKQVAEISSISIKTLAENTTTKRNYHFHIDYPNTKMIKLIKERFGISKLDAHCIPSVGQFELYTPQTFIKGNKAPRIHFIIGPSGVFYIFLFDLFHEIYPRKENHI